MFSEKTKRKADEAHNLMWVLVSFFCLAMAVYGKFCVHHETHHAYHDLPALHRVSMAAAFDAVEDKRQVHMTDTQAVRAVLYVFAEE